MTNLKIFFNSPLILAYYAHFFKMCRQLLWIMLGVLSLQPKAECDLKRALNDFSLNFLSGYNHQQDNENANLFYSPISLANPLSMLIAGAKSQTRKELVDLLGYDNLMKNRSLEADFKKVEPFNLNFLKKSF